MNIEFLPEIKFYAYTVDRIFLNEWWIATWNSKLSLDKIDEMIIILLSNSLLSIFVLYNFVVIDITI